MWLREYLLRRWGLFTLVGGLTVLALWAFGGGGKAPSKKQPRGTPKGKAAVKRVAPVGKLDAKSVVAACVRSGIRADSPPQPNQAAVRHPGFPRKRAKAPRLGKAARGLFPLRKRLALLPAWTLAHARQIHRLARGFTQRYHYYTHLSQNRRALRRWHRNQQKRKRAGGAAGDEKPPAAMLLRTRSQGYRKNALGYYRRLTTGKQFQGYAKRAAALLEYASLLMSPAPLTLPRPRLPKGKKGKRARSKTLSAAGIGVLHRLIKEHPNAPEAIEALSFLAARSVAGGQCPKVIFLLKGLPQAPLPRTTPARLALLRGYAHYHAGRCLLAKGTGEAAAKRLLRAVTDANVATAAGTKHGSVISREAAILLGRAAASSGDPAQNRKLLAAVGPASAKIVTAVLVAQLAKEGLIKQAAILCTPTPAAPKGRPE